MTDYVSNESFGVTNEIINKDAFFNKVRSYCKFLKQTPQLWMFVPCDSEGNVLEEPKEHFPTGNNSLEESIFLKQKQYQQAKERCYFEGFVKCNRNENVNCLYNEELDLHIGAEFKHYQTIENLVDYNLTLTATAQKEIV